MSDTEKKKKKFVQIEISLCCVSASIAWLLFIRLCVWKNANALSEKNETKSNDNFILWISSELCARCWVYVWWKNQCFCMLSKSRRILEKITRDWDIQKHTTTAHNTEALSIAIQQKPKQQKKVSQNKFKLSSGSLRPQMDNRKLNTEFIT